MTSQPRPQRPAATDYFNPTEQLELLQSIKVKAQKSATATPQESHPPVREKPPPSAMTTTTSQPVDYVAHEMSLREKLEKAKAEREAKAKLEAALSGNSQTTHTALNTASATAHTDGSHNVSVKNNVPEPPAGPPPPPIQNNKAKANTTPANPIPTPTSTYGPTWVQNQGYSQQTNSMGYPRPPFPQFPQPSFPPYGMPPFTNGQSMYPQWGQFPATPTPGIPPLPVQVNHGPPNPTPPNQMSATNAGSLGQNAMNHNQSPPNHNPMGSVPPAQTDIRPGMPPQFGGPPTFPQSQQQPGIPPRPPMLQAPQSQTVPPQQQPQQQQQTSSRHQLPVQQNQNGPPAPLPAEQSGTAPKGPGGSIYNTNPPAPQGPPNHSPSTDIRGSFPPSLNSSQLPPPNTSPPPHRPESPRGRPPSPRYEPRNPHLNDELREYRRRISGQGPNEYPREGHPPSPRMQHSSRYSSDISYPPPRDSPYRSTFPGPPSRMSYRDRSRSPPPPGRQREDSADYTRPRPMIPEEGYRRENWDIGRGGYKNPPAPFPPNYSLEHRRGYSPSPPPAIRRGGSPPPPRYPPPRRDLGDPYFRNGPPPPRDYPPPHPDAFYRPPPALRQRSRSPRYLGYPPSPPPLHRDYPPPPERGYYEPPLYPLRAGYPRYPSPPPPGPPPPFDRRREYDEYYPPPSPGPPPPMPQSFPPPDDRAYRAPSRGGYRDFRADREVRRPPSPYSHNRPGSRGRGRGRGY